MVMRKRTAGPAQGTLQERTARGPPLSDSPQEQQQEIDFISRLTSPSLGSLRNH